MKENTVAIVRQATIFDLDSNKTAQALYEAEGWKLQTNFQTYNQPLV